MSELNSCGLTEKIEYPAEFHFRVICDTSADVFGDILAVAARFKISRSLNESNSSRTGKYRSYSISVVFEERSQMIIFDESVKAIPGVRMLL